MSPTLLRKVSAAHQAGAVPYEIAARVKKSEPTVRKYLKALGLKPHKPPRKRTRKHSGPQVFPLFCRASVGPKLEQAAAGAMAFVAKREVARLRRCCGGPT